MALVERVCVSVDRSRVRVVGHVSYGSELVVTQHDRSPKHDASTILHAPPAQAAAPGCRLGLLSYSRACVFGDALQHVVV